MNKDQLKAAFAKGARIQAWHLLPGATNSNQGQWDTLTPAEGAEPEFGCEAHLYRVHPEDLSLIAELGQEVGAVAWRRPDVYGTGWVYYTTKPDHPQAEPLYTSPAHTSEARDAVVGEVVEIGDDDEGQPRILIHTTREAIKNGPPLAFRTVSVAAMRQEGGTP